jgi:hypothetical protein
VTTLELSRLDYLQQLCLSWPGPLVAAFYAPLEQTDDRGGTLSDDNAGRMEQVLEVLQELFLR